MKKLSVLTALLVAFVLFSHGALSPRTARADVPPFGTFSGTITAETLSNAGISVPSAATFAGVWSITFSPDFTYTASYDGVAQSNGTFSADLTTMTFTDTDGTQSCLDQGSPTGAYTYFWDGVTLEFSDPSDDCLGRLIVLTGTTYTLDG